MATPVETIADALVAFIMSLLHDPEAATEFAEQPQSMLAQHGLGGVCMADVAAVRPVIVDHPTVIHHQNPPAPTPEHHGPISEIVRMIQQYTTVDARSTIVDQSVNQNIWTEGGDVTQLFDQEAVIASGDDSVAAGDDATLVDSDVDVSVGDVSAGNSTNTDSFNNTGLDDAVVDDAAPEEDLPDSGTGDALAGAATASAVDTAVDAAQGAATDVTDAPAEAAPAEAAPAEAAPASVPEPADLLEADMTSGADTYEADATSAAVQNDAPLEDPIEDD